MNAQVPSRQRAFVGGVFLHFALVAGFAGALHAAGAGSREELRDVALGKPVAATSTGFWRTPPAHITDGDPETGWRAISSDPLPYYVEVDLQGAYWIERVRVVEGMRNGGYRLTAYGIFASIDGRSWEKLHEGGTVGRGITVAVEPRLVRYLRLAVIGDDGLDLPMITQIAAFGREGQPGEDLVPRRAASAGSEIQSFSLRELSLRGEVRRAQWPRREILRDADGRYRFVEEYDRTISLVAPAASDLSALTAVFRTDGAQVFVDGVPQESGVTRNDFRRPLTYTVAAEDGTASDYVVTVHQSPAEASITIHNETIGTSMPYVGFSAMDITKGDNLPQWYAYSNVNGVRYWLTPGRLVGSDHVTDDETVTDLRAFDDRRADLRRRMLERPYDGTWINWAGVRANNEELVQQGRRRTTHHALTELRELGIDIMAALNDSGWAEPFADGAERWRRAWVLWQMFYAQSFYLAANFDVRHFQGPNEPEHLLGRYSSSVEERAAAVERFVFMNAVYSDAMRSAVEDVNELFGKSLAPLWGAPTLASSPTSDVGIATIRANRTNYRGDAVEHDVTDLFILQSYSGSAASFLGSNEAARRMMREHNPSGEALPVAYTEFNYMPGSVWRNQNFTGDAPHVFRAMSRIWAESMRNGVYGMYQFRIARPIDLGGSHLHHMFRTHRDPACNLLHGKPHRVSSEAPGHPLSNVLLNASSAHFAWRTAEGAEGPHEAVWDLGDLRDIRQYLMNLGTREEGLEEAVLQYWSEEDGEWVAFPGGDVRNGSIVQHGGTPRPMPTYNRHATISNVPSVIRERALSEPVRTRAVRFYSESPGPITVRRIYVSDVATEGDIGGPTKSGEVTRLFAEGFSGGRPLFRTETTVPHIDDYRAYTAYDGERDRYSIWVPQPSDRVDFRTTFDLGRLEGAVGGLVTVREVSAERFGDLVFRGTLDESGTFTLVQPPSSVWLVTLQRGNALDLRRKFPSDSAQIGLGTAAGTIFSSQETMIVRQHTTSLDKNRAVYLKFDLAGVPDSEVKTALLSVTGQWVTEKADFTLPDGERFTIHVYGIEENGWSSGTITGATAPHFGQGDSLVRGPGVLPLAVVSFGAELESSTVDVTKWIRERAGQKVSLVLVRERRHENEINETDFIVLHSKEADEELRPRLDVWVGSETVASSLLEP